MPQLLFSILVLTVIILPSIASEFFSVFSLEDNAAQFVRENFISQSLPGGTAVPEAPVAVETPTKPQPKPAVPDQSTAPLITEVFKEEIEKFIPAAVPQPSTALLTSDEVYRMLDTAVVQVVCRLNDRFTISGSGVVVSPAGIVLTNTHVVENATDCFVRTGNPAVYGGRLTILYRGSSEKKIPETDVPLEDYAFGKIVDVPAHAKFSLPFKYLVPNADYSHARSEHYFLAAYASELAGGGGTTPQNLVFTITKLLGFFAIGSEGKEVLELEGNISTQEGASGSPIISVKDGSVVGLVFGQNKGEGEGVETGQRTEYAFSLSYIDKTLRDKEGSGLQEFIEKLGRN